MTDISQIEHSDSPEEITCYSYDASYVEAIKPLMVAWPRNTDEVSSLLKYASERGISVMARGAGTGMTGSAVPYDPKTIVVSLEKMKKVLDINTKNMTVQVEPGILNGTLQKELYCLGFFYPPDPSSMNFCTIGGNIATNAGGPRAVKYGVTRDYVMELEAVLADGSVIRTGGRSHKRVVGYSLKDLLIGSEGTLAVVTKIRLKMLPLPEDTVTLLASFDDVAKSAESISRIFASKIIPRALEFIDKGCIEAVERYRSQLIPAGSEALLLIELDGHSNVIKQDAERIAAICNSLQGNVSAATDAFSREHLWEARRSISPALYHLRKSKISEDVVVPRDRIPEVLSQIKALSDKHQIDIFCFGHAGDGNIHVNIMTDQGGHRDSSVIEGVIRDIFDAVIHLGGSLSGEHGIGTTKAPFLSMEIQERQICLMKDIKRIFDPENRLNPGKIFSLERQ